MNKIASNFSKCYEKKKTDDCDLGGTLVWVTKNSLDEW